MIFVLKVFWRVFVVFTKHLITFSKWTHDAKQQYNNTRNPFLMPPNNYIIYDNVLSVRLHALYLYCFIYHQWNPNTLGIWLKYIKKLFTLLDSQIAIDIMAVQSLSLFPSCNNCSITWESRSFGVSKLNKRIQYFQIWPRNTYSDKEPLLRVFLLVSLNRNVKKYPNTHATIKPVYHVPSKLQIWFF